ncbi:hypothetical protein [Rhodoplanes azumiensis]|uniref:Uncharacterized protein n=1 Tax=Rhodoplanes azumiensis TaxID=1897628 RepID=A0ABW5AQX1_9BRAD
MVSISGKPEIDAVARRGPAAPGTSEAVNLSIFALFDLSQINDLVGPETPKTGKIHKLSG